MEKRFMYWYRPGTWGVLHCRPPGLRRGGAAAAAFCLGICLMMPHVADGSEGISGTAGGRLRLHPDHALFLSAGMVSDVSPEKAADSPGPDVQKKDTAASGQKTETDPLRADEKYHDIIAEAGERYEVETALIKAIIKAESQFDPRAVSHRGARGLMQLMPRTARALGVEDSFNPEHNIHGGTRYFSELLNKFDGEIRLALAAYNAGSRKVRKYGGVPPYKATRIYIRKVFQYYQFFKKQEAI